MLELPKKISGLKPASHMLTCHGGHLYIHTLWQGRSLFEDPPPIPDASGGKVNDYRFTVSWDTNTKLNWVIKNHLH